jgi:diguanylate cyclase (GGDEF)-like protein
VANNLLLDTATNGAMASPPLPKNELGDMHDTPAAGYFGETRDLASLVEATSYSTLLCDVAGRIVQISGTPELVFGFDRAGMSGQSVLGAIPTESQQSFVDAFNSALGGHTPQALRFSKPGPWGGTLQVELSIEPLLENGAVVGLQVSGAELSLVTLINALYSGDFNSAARLATEAPTVVYFLDGNGQCTSINDRWSILSGQQSDDALGIGFLSRIPSEDQVRFRTVAAAAHTARAGWRLQLSVITAGQSTWLVDTASASIGRPDGSLLGYVGVITPFSTALAGAATEPATTLAPQSADPASNVPSAQSSPSADFSSSVPEAEAVAISTSAPAPQHVLVPHNISALETAGTADRQWTAPLIKEGYTDPSLLATPQKAEDELELPAPAASPGTDKVTGLSNRLLFAQGVSSTVGRMQADALTVSVSFIDLHGLETIRQQFGARSTNDYLFLLARRLESTIRSIESCGRIDGDVLGVLSVNWLFAEDLPIVAQRLIGRLQEPLAGKDGGELIIATNLGMAVARPGEHVNDIFARAWESLQRSKADTGSQWQIDYGV